MRARSRVAGGGEAVAGRADHRVHGGGEPSGHWVLAELTTRTESNAPTTAPRLSDIRMDEHRAAAQIQQGAIGTRGFSSTEAGKMIPSGTAS